MSTLIKQGSSGTPLRFLMVDSTDHITGKTGLTPTVTISKNGAAFAAPAGAVSELSGGWYKVAGHVTDSNTLGPIDLHATAAGADPTDMKDCATVVSFDPTDGAALGLTRIDAAMTSRMATFTLPANFSALSISATTGLVDITQAAADKVWSSAARTLTSFGTLVSDIWGALLSGITTAGSIGKLLKDNITGVLMLGSSYSAPPSAASIRSEMDTNSTKLANLDATMSSRLAAAGYTAPDNAGIAAIKTKTDQLVFTNVGKLDVQVRGMDVGVVDAAALASDAEAEIVAALKTSAFDGSFTFQQIIQLCVAVLAGKLSGEGTGTITIRDISDTKNILTTTVDATGRVSVTFNV